MAGHAGGRVRQPDKASLASVDSGVRPRGRSDLARDAFEQGKAKHVECDVVTVNVLLDACASERPRRRAGRAHGRHRERDPGVACTISSLSTRTARTERGKNLPRPRRRCIHQRRRGQRASTRGGLVEQTFAIVELGKFLSVDPTPPVMRSCASASRRAPRTRRATFDEYLVALAEASDGSELAERVDSLNASLAVLIEGFAAAGDVPVPTGARGRRRASSAWTIRVGDGSCARASDAGESELAMRAYDDATKNTGSSRRPR